MTANYNTIHIDPLSKSKTWQPGETFAVDLNSHSIGWRVKVFNGLKIESVAFNFGQMLYFDHYAWLKAKDAYFKSLPLLIEKTNDGTKFPKF